MKPIDLEKLRYFIKEGDKNTPPEFIGREKITEDIEEIADSCYKKFKQRDVQRATTRIIEGAPGCGKTSLLAQLRRNWEAPTRSEKPFFFCRQSRKKRTPLILEISEAGWLNNHTDFAKALVGILDKRKSVRVGEMTSKNSGNIFGTGFGFLSGKVTLSRSSERFNEIADPMQEVLRLVKPQKWKRPVVVAIDEFQNISGEKDSPHIRMLRGIHTGQYPVPIMIVCAGLCDTVQKLHELGISRPSSQSVHSLGRFNEYETRELIDRWGDHFNIPDNEVWKSAVLDMAKEVEYWPAHVHNALISLSIEIVAKEGDMSRLNMGGVKENEANLRYKYYSDRISPQLDESPHLFFSVMNDFKDGVRKIDVLQLIHKHQRENAAGWNIPSDIVRDKKTAGVDYFNHLLHQGIIQMVNKRLECPIPSLHMYIRKYYTPEQSDYPQGS